MLGCSSFTGLLEENGPYRFIDESSNLKDFENSWIKKAHMLFIDNPVGTGLSTVSTFVTDEDQVAEDFYSGLKEFFSLHPEYATLSLYITGESYAGKYIPSIADYILTQNEKGGYKINLKGVGIGNGLMYPNVQRLIKADQIFNHALVDYTQREVLQDVMLQCSAQIQNQDLYPGACDRYPDYFSIASGGINQYDLRRFDDTTNRTRRESFINTAEFRDAIHAPFEKKAKFVGCDSKVAQHLEKDVLKSVKHLIPRLVKSGIKVLIFGGNFDLKDNPIGIDQMFLSTAFFNEEFGYKNIRREVFVNSLGQVAGYVKQKDNFAFITLHGAGHYVPTDQGLNALEMIEKLLTGERYCSDENVTFKTTSDVRQRIETGTQKKCFEVAKYLCEETTNNCNKNGNCNDIGYCECNEGWTGNHCGWKQVQFESNEKKITFELLNQHWYHISTNLKKTVFGDIYAAYESNEITNDEYLEGKIVGEGLGTSLPWNKVCIFGKKGSQPTYRSYHFVHCTEGKEYSSFLTPYSDKEWKFAIWNGIPNPVNITLLLGANLPTMRTCSLFERILCSFFMCTSDCL